VAGRECLEHSSYLFDLWDRVMREIQNSGEESLVAEFRVDGEFIRTSLHCVQEECSIAVRPTVVDSLAGLAIDKGDIRRHGFTSRVNHDTINFRNAARSKLFRKEVLNEFTFAWAWSITYQVSAQSGHGNILIIAGGIDKIERDGLGPNSIVKPGHEEIHSTLTSHFIRRENESDSVRHDARRL